MYCSKECQQNHWKEHKPLCKAVGQVEQKLAEDQERKYKLPDQCKVSYLSAKQEKRLISLIGRQNLVKCSFDNVPVTALWDTGAQSTVINDTWRCKHLPHSTIRPIEELLGPLPLNGVAANQTVIQWALNNQERSAFTTCVVIGLNCRSN